MSDEKTSLQLERVRAVCFDAYGTLVPALLDDPYRDLLVALPRDRALFLRTLWLTSAVSWEEACVQAQIPAALCPQLTARLRAACEAVALTPTARRAIAACRRRGWKLALASNLAQPYATEALRRAVADFDAVVWSFDCGMAKPEPSFFDEVAHRLNVPPAHCLMVGDSLSSDVRGAQACGWQALWLGRQDAEGMLQAWANAVDAGSA